LVEPKKPEELASAILKLLDDESLRNSLAEGALKYVTQKFDMKAICEIIMRSYEESLKK
jgi:glycosyltransferase involved in cell wall biosynthesis